MSETSPTETLDYLRSVIDGRTEISWFTDSVVGADAVSGPLDIFVKTSDGEVTWGWSVSPIPVDVAGRSYRRFRSSPDSALFVDADEPELIFLNHELDLHSLSDGTGTAFAIAVPTGQVPDVAAAFDLEKTAREAQGGYSIDPAYSLDSISVALELWTASLLEEAISFVWEPLTPETTEAIDALAGLNDLPEGDTPVGYDAEIADIVGGFMSAAWLQPDLTWPDADNIEAFRDHVDVRFRHPSLGLVYLASIDQLGSGNDPSFMSLEDGAPMNLDHSDPTVIGLAPDRLVLAINRQADGYEPAGLAVPWGRPPMSDEWAELRRFQADHPDAILIHASGWSEHRVASALAAWGRAWTDVDVEFAYDYEDPIPQAIIEANESLAESTLNPETFIRTATADRCTHTESATTPNEDPFPCGRLATHYFTPGGSSEGVVLVCDSHIPPSGNAAPLLK